jgi:transposase
MAAKVVLGIDVSKGWFDVCLQQGDERWQGRFDNSGAGFRRLATWLDKWLSAEQQARVHACMEATGRYGEALAYWLQARDYRVSIVNPALIKSPAQSMGQRHKSDRLDARVIADYCLKHQPTAWQPLSPAQAVLQALVRQLDALERMHTQEQNRLQAGPLPPEVEVVIRAHLHFMAQQIAHLQQQIQQQIDQDPHLKQQQALLVTIKGLGALTAAKLLGELPPIEHFTNARAVAAYAGLNPRRVSSGKGQLYTRLSKQGNAALRKALYLPAMSAKQHNPILRAFAERLAANGKAPMEIIAAVMRKLLHLVYGVLKHQQPFDPLYLSR